MPTAEDQPSPDQDRRATARAARSLRLRLEDDGRAGLAAVPRAAARPAPSPLPEGEGAGVRGPLPSIPHSALRTPHSVASPEARAADRAKEELARQAAARPREEPPDEPPPAAPAVHVPGQVALDFGTPDLEDSTDHAEALARVAAEVAECTRCPELVANRTLTVPGQGSPYARLVFVGEGPGQEEDRRGLAFVGRAGELLTKMIEAIGMTREEVFIANIVKCRPPGNRQPQPDEAANCAGYLARQLEILRPKIIVALGGTAAQHLLQTCDGITRLRGRFYTYGAAQLMPTFHPAYVLRNHTPDTRKKVYDDLLKVKAALVA